jgi:hypothetical protein
VQWPGWKGQRSCRAGAQTEASGLLRKKNGEFPTFQVSNIIQGDAVITAHGSKEMPIWGDVFRALKRDEAVSEAPGS